MTDIASLGIAVDARPVKDADAALDHFVATGERAEQTTKDIAKASDIMAADLRELVAAIKANTSATQENTSASAAAEAGAKAMASAEKMAADSKRASAQASDEAARAAKELADAERRAAAEASDLADRVAKLKASVDPYGFAQDKANDELREATMLYQQGAIGAEEYAHAQTVIAQRLGEFEKRQAIFNSGLGSSAKNLRLTAAEGVNFGRQMADVGVTAAMGMNPLMIAIQQGPQILDIFSMAAARTGKTVQQVAYATMRAWLAALAPFLPLIAAVAAGAAVVAGAWGLATRNINKGVGDNIDHLKLNEKQLERLKEKNTELGVTGGDAFKALGTTIKEKFVDMFGDQLEWLGDKWNDFLDFVTEYGIKGIKVIGGAWVGGFFAIKDTWAMLPAAFSDIAVSATNYVITSINDMVKKAVDGLNTFGAVANGVLAGMGSPLRVGRIASAPQLDTLDNPNAGAAARAGQAAVGGFARGMEWYSDQVDEFGEDWQRNAGRTRDARVRKDAGKPGEGRQGKSDAEKEYERQLKASQEFLKSLKEETAEIGKNAIEIKMMAVAREAAVAPTQELKTAITAAGQAWKDATIKAATDELIRDLQDANSEIAFQNSLVGKNAEERAVANAQHEIEIRLRDLARQGIDVSTEAIRAETEATLENARAKGALAQAAEDARHAAEDYADVSDRLKSLTADFGDLFGVQGGAIADLMTTWSDYGQHVLDIQQRIAEAEAQYGKDSIEANRERQRSAYEMSTAEAQYYGDMISSAKGFFDQKSAGYRILRTAEQAYRLYQFAMSAQAIIRDTLETTAHAANSSTRIATDGAETASSVAKSGIRAAADGVAAFAKTLASLPFPFNLAAGAVVLAALVGVGVKMAGGGKSASASAANDNSSTTYDPPSTYTPFVSHDTGTPGYLNHAPVSPSSAQSGAAGMSVSRTTVLDFSNANFGNSDPEQVKKAVRDGIEEAKPDLLADARSQSLEDLKAVGRQQLGGGR